MEAPTVETLADNTANIPIHVNIPPAATSNSDECIIEEEVILPPTHFSVAEQAISDISGNITGNLEGLGFGNTVPNEEAIIGGKGDEIKNERFGNDRTDNEDLLEGAVGGAVGGTVDEDVETSEIIIANIAELLRRLVRK